MIIYPSSNQAVTSPESGLKRLLSMSKVVSLANTTPQPTVAPVKPVNKTVNPVPSTSKQVATGSALRVLLPKPICNSKSKPLVVSPSSSKRKLPESSLKSVPSVSKVVSLAAPVKPMTSKRVTTRVEIMLLPTAKNLMPVHTKFTFARNKRDDFCVFAVQEPILSFFCVCCSPKIKLLNQNFFVEHIEREHFKASIAHILCNSCQDPVDRKDFEFHMRMRHYQDDDASFNLLSLDDDFERKSWIPKFSLTLRLLDYGLEKQCFINVVPSSNRWNYFCQICKMELHWLKNLILHIAQTHLFLMGQIVCEECDEILSTNLLPHHIFAEHRKYVELVFKVRLEQKPETTRITETHFKAKVVTQQPKPSIQSTPNFTFSYDVDLGNDHCVIVKSTNIPNSFSCTLCQISFEECFELIDHIETSHIHDKISYSICEKCCSVLNSLFEFAGHVTTLHTKESQTHEFQFKLISLKTSVLEDIEEGLTMRDMLTPSPPPSSYINDAESDLKLLESVIFD